MMNAETIKIAITPADPNSPVAIMDLIVTGNGTILPEGALWVNKDIGVWRREPTDAIIKKQVDRASQSYLGAVSGYRVIDANEVPTDRTFRDAWEHNGKTIVHNMEKVRNIHLNNLRIERAAILEQKDKEWMRALGQKNTAEADRIEAERQALRDMPETISNALKSATTPDEVKLIKLEV